MTGARLLIDPWFEARFVGCGDAKRRTFSFVDSLAAAQGVQLWCPCGHGKPEYPIDGARPHAIIIPFANPPCGVLFPEALCPTSKDGKTRPRWTVSGSGLHDLTLSPSIDVGDPSCWHSFITNGVVQ